jgi:hypothetical protein
MVDRSARVMPGRNRSTMEVAERMRRIRTRRRRMTRLEQFVLSRRAEEAESSCRKKRKRLLPRGLCAWAR